MSLVSTCSKHQPRLITRGLTMSHLRLRFFFCLAFILFSLLRENDTNHSSTLLHILSYISVAKEFPNATTVLVLATGHCFFRSPGHGDSCSWCTNTARNSCNSTRFSSVNDHSFSLIGTYVVTVNKKQTNIPFYSRYVVGSFSGNGVTYEKVNYVVLRHFHQERKIVTV